MPILPLALLLHYKSLGGPIGEQAKCSFLVILPAPKTGGAHSKSWEDAGALSQPGMLPLLGHWHLGSGFGLHARGICSLRLLIETWKGGFHWVLCVAQGEGQPRKQNKGKRPVDAEHMRIGLRETTVLLFTSFLTKTRSRSHFAYSSNPLGPWIFPAFVQLESLFLTIWL